jgi:hypothetical protein
MKKILFLSGVARSGTSALVQILNLHPRLLIGQERFFFRVREESLVPADFEPGRFLTVAPGDTHSGGIFGKPDLQKAYGAATYVGDKYPLLFNHFDYVFRTFPQAEHVYIFRNPLSVAESYEARRRNPDDHFTRTWRDGLEDWNASVRRVAGMEPERLRRFHLVQYEDFFDQPGRMNGLFARLGLPRINPDLFAPFVEKFRALNKTPVPRRDRIRQQVALSADWDAYRALHELAVSQHEAGKAGRRTKTGDGSSE